MEVHYYSNRTQPTTFHKPLYSYYINISKLHIKIEGTTLHILELKTFQGMWWMLHDRTDIRNVLEQVIQSKESASHGIRWETGVTEVTAAELTVELRVMSDKMSETSFFWDSDVFSYEWTPSFERCPLCSIIIFSGTFSSCILVIAVARRLWLLLFSVFRPPNWRIVFSFVSSVLWPI